ncbi:MULTISPECIES: hypothetical protein [unclassified Vibrio]|uniref:hypothetical protein n=1 Tax=unclassified Vibrio TaxID=2614977 RepID=UPI00354F9B10
MKKYLGLLILVFTSNVNSAVKRYEEKIRIQSEVDVSKLYTQSITDIKMIPDNINLKVMSDGSRFESETVSLVIETDIPNQVSGVTLNVPYRVELTENKAECANRIYPSNKVDFSASQKMNPTFVAVKISKVGSGSNDYTYTGIGSHDGVTSVNDFSEVYIPSGGIIEMKKNTHQLNLDFLAFNSIASIMPTGSALNTECSGSLLFTVTVGI